MESEALSSAKDKGGSAVVRGGHLLVYIPAYNEFPLDKAREKVARSPAQLDHIKSGQQKAVPTYETYIAKIAKPRLEAFTKSLNPAFVSKSDLTAEELSRRRREKLFDRTAYENYIKDRPVQQILDKIPLNAAKYATQMTFGVWRLAGHLIEGSQSALEISLGWLAGDKKITRALRAQDKLVQGGPVLVIPPQRIGEFKRKLRTLLKRMLDIIQCGHYEAKVVSEQNHRLNQFVDSYVSPEFVVSIKWLVNYETAQTWHSPEVLKIRGEIYKKLLSPESFRKLADIFAPPADPLGHPAGGPLGHPAGENLKCWPDKLLMDMFLDIRISKR